MKKDNRELPSPMRVEQTDRPLKIAVIYSRPPLPMTRTDQKTVAHLLDFLSQRGHRVDLYSLKNGEPTTPAQRAWLGERCRRVILYNQRIRRNLLGMGVGLIKGLPLQVGWFYNSKQIRSVQAAILDGDLDIVYCYYIRSAEPVRNLLQLTHATERQKRRRPVTLLAMQLSQSLNTRRMMENFHTWRDRLIYSVERRLVRRYEAQIWSKFHRTVLIGPKDVEEIKCVCREYGQPEIDNFFFGPHGVDIRLYAPRQEIAPDPYTLVFCADMGVKTNIHAITWFVQHVWPLVKQSEPRARLLIVGRRVTPTVQAMAAQDGIEVTGEVPNPADYIVRATVCINPVRAAAGMQNKLLEYLAMGKPAVTTFVANEGIGAIPGKHLLIADSPGDFADYIALLFNNPELRNSLGQAARTFIEANWTWEKHFLDLEQEMYDALDKIT
jgi:polysaccharide biosynthesis protein PslH